MFLEQLRAAWCHSPPASGHRFRAGGGGWHPGGVTDPAENTNNEPATEPIDAAAAERAARIENLVHEWCTVPELAELQGVKPGDVRRQIKDGELIAVRRGENNSVQVPAAFIADGAPLPRLRGTFTVLKDGGMDDSQIIEWLFAPDDTLPEGGSPMETFRAGRVTEVRRRALETAL